MILEAKNVYYYYQGGESRRYILKDINATF